MQLMRHLLLPRGTLGRRFPTATLTAIETAIAASERAHRAEIRFAIEVALDVACLWRVRTVRERALEVFADLGVWNTVERNGVLLYVLLAERRVEIVADQGLEGRVTEAEWRHCCTLVEREFRSGLWREGALRGVEAITALLIREFPGAGPNPNEQPDRPALL